MISSWITKARRALLASITVLAAGCVSPDLETEEFREELGSEIERTPGERARQNHLQVMASLGGGTFGDQIPTSIAVHDHIDLNVSPAMTEFEGRLYAAFKAGDGTQRLCVARSDDGVSFGAQTCHDGLVMKNRPAMVAFEDRLYIAFRPADGSDRLCVTRSDDGVLFRPTPRCYDHVPLAAGPALAVFNDRLYVAANTGPQLAVTSSLDGVSFDSPQVHDGIQLQNSPAMAVFEDRLYISFKANDGSDTLVVTRSDDGVAFRTPARHYAGVQLADSPSMTTLGGKLQIAYRPRGQDDQLRVVASADGVSFGGPTSYDTALLQFGPGLGVFNGRLHIPFKGPDGHLHVVVVTDGALSDHPAVVEHISSEVGPAMAEFEGRLYLAFKADDGSNQLCIARKVSGGAFGTPQCHPGLLMKNRPAMAVFEDRLYVAFRPADGSDRLCVTRSDDGVLFRPTPRCYDHVSLSDGPAMAAFQGRLYVAVNDGNTLAVTSSLDGVTFDSSQVHGGLQLQNSPAMATFEDRLYIAFKANDSSNTLYVTRSDDGVAFRTPARHYADIQLTQSPAMAAFEDRLYIAFRANDESGKLYVTDSADGVNFSAPARRYDAARVHNSPAMAAYAGRLYIPFMGRDDIEVAWAYAPVWSFDDEHFCYPLKLDEDDGDPDYCKQFYDPGFTVFASVTRRVPGSDTFRVSYFVPYGKQLGRVGIGPVEIGSFGADVEGVVVDVVDGELTSVRYNVHKGAYVKMASSMRYHEGRPLVYVGALFHASYDDTDKGPIWGNFGDERGSEHRSVGNLRMLADTDPSSTDTYSQVAHDWNNAPANKNEVKTPYSLETCDSGSGSEICDRSDLDNTAGSPGTWVTSWRDPEPLTEFQLDGTVVGGSRGIQFNDIGRLQPNQVRGVQLFAGNRVDALEVSYYAGDDTTIVRHGGDGGYNRGYIDPTSDPIIEMEACRGVYEGNTRVFYLRLETLSGNEIAGGTHTDDCHIWYGDADRHIAGFYGRSNNELDMVGPIWELR